MSLRNDPRLQHMEALEPTVVERVPQTYVGVRAVVTMETIGTIADRIPELAARGITPAGAPFLRYLTIDMARQLEVEAGVPVREPVQGADGVDCRWLPGGRYVVATHVGHPDGLIDATSDLLRWAADKHLHWDVRDTPAGEAWGCRLEVFNTDPHTEPDMGLWSTDLVFRLAG
jgi:RNA polymerase sigma-70 factor (ECF subfamily)